MPLNPRLRIGSLLAISSAAFFMIGRFTAPHPVLVVSTSDSQNERGMSEGETTGPASGKGRAGHSAAAGSRAMPPALTKLLGSLAAGGSLKNQMAILQYATSLDAGAARAAAIAFEGMGRNMDKNATRLADAVLARWAELDPQGVLQSARSSPDRYFRSKALSAGMDALCQKSPAKAWEAASAMGEQKVEAQTAALNALGRMAPETALKFAGTLKGYDRDRQLGNVLGMWAENDPAGASSAALALPSGRGRNSAVSVVVAKWAATDFEAASAWAATLPRASERLYANYAALNSLVQVDPERTLTLLSTTELGASKNSLRSQAFYSMALTDFDGLLGRMSEFKDFNGKAEALTALAGAASDENRDKLLALASSLPANLARKIYEGGIWNIMQSDSGRALEHIAKIPIASVREQAMSQAAESLTFSEPDQAGLLFSRLQTVSQDPMLAGTIASAMAWADPQKAIAWASQLGTEALKKSALTQAMSAWAQSDPAAAGQELARISNAETRAEVTRTVANAIAERSLEEAEKWAGALSGADQSAALGKIVEQAATQAPDRLESLYSRFVSSLSEEAAARSENQGIARTVATQLAETDAAKAATWSMSLPEGGARDEAVSGMISTWAGYDAVGASQWLQNLPAGKARDLAAGNLVTTIAKDDPESAWAWATSITDTARRRDAAAAALSGWKANGNRDAALIALEAGGFSEADHKELARKLE